MDLEQYFLRDNIEACRFTCICAGKASGKSHLFLSYFKLFYAYNKYDKYILILPELHTEIDKKYDFLITLNNVVIYTEYNESVFEEAKKLSSEYKILLCIDDATNIMFKNKGDGIITKIASTTRHGKGIALFLITHALSNILLPQVRALLDHVFIGVFGNAKVIKNQLYEENFSIKMSYEEFKNIYVKNIVDKEEDHPFLYFNRKRQFDYNVHTWEMLSYYNKVLPKTGKAEVKQIDYNKIHMKKLKEQQHINEMRASLRPEKPKKVVLNRRLNL